METVTFLDPTMILRLVLTAVVAFAATFVAAKVLIPVLKRKKAEQHVRDDGPQTHLVKEGTPTMGGIMMLIGIVIAVLACSVYIDGSFWMVLFLLASTVLYAMIGFADDSIKLFKKRSLGLRAWQKIVFQFAVSAGVACFAYFALKDTYEVVPFSHHVIDMGMWEIPFTMFVLIAMVNSVNLTDGLDGLATSLTLTNGLAFLAIVVSMLAIVPTRGVSFAADTLNTGVFACALVGACAAFLIFNRHPAQVFMGDTGSFALGAAITVTAVALHIQFILPIIGLMFVLSAISVIIQVGSFKLRGKRVFRMAPLHHHFELKPMPETRVVMGYLIVTILLSVVGVLGYVL